MKIRVDCISDEDLKAFALGAKLANPEVDYTKIDDFSLILTMPDSNLRFELRNGRLEFDERGC